jgi:3-dehydroquinate synthase
MSVEIPVPLGERSYSVFVDTGELAASVPGIVALHGEGPVTCITDENVAAHHGAAFMNSLQTAGMDVQLHVVAPGEASKTLATAEGILKEMIGAGMGRTRPVIALGGGVVGDLAGFVGSVYRRGVPVVQVATSLLAQVDSSVGGKTAVNMGGAKNQIGTFHQPSLVIAALGALKTLPEREVRCGLAELFKAGLLGDPALLEGLEERRDAVQAGDPEALMDLVVGAIEVKRDVVVADERESGLRAVLNLGHTFGHAIEAATGYGTLTHGEAVALGMVMAARVSAIRGLCDPGFPDWISGRLYNQGLPVDPAPYANCGWEETLRKDKKAAGERITMVFPVSVGEVTRDEVALDQAIFWLQTALSG